MTVLNKKKELFLKDKALAAEKLCHHKNKLHLKTY